MILFNQKVYSQSSAITHPNYEGTWGFYSKGYENNRWLFKRPGKI